MRIQNLVRNRPLVSAVLLVFIILLTGLAGCGAGEETAPASAPSAPDAPQAAPREPERGIAARPPSRRAGDLSPGDVQVYFLIAPKITRSLYMGERWASPPAFTSYHTGERAVIGAKAMRLVRMPHVWSRVEAAWESGDPVFLKVEPPEGQRTQLIVTGEGETEMTVTSGGVTARLKVESRIESKWLRVTFTRQPAGATREG